MRTFTLFCLAAAIGLTSCQKSRKESTVVSTQYIHKYGYAVTKEEWDSHNYPGQVVTHLRDGVTLTKTYEAGLLHGPCTYTYPYSEMIHHFYLYDKGDLVKQIDYDSTGMPEIQKSILSPTRYQLIYWYKDGTPRAIEDYSNEELLDGQYLSRSNEVEAKVEQGKGTRITRDKEGLLLAKETIESGYSTEKETFYPSGTLESVTHYATGKLHGEKQTFSTSGEPISDEEYLNGLLHGKSTYYRNGNKFQEISYIAGQKNGLETHYLDGEQISYQVLWENDKKHGPEQYFTAGGTITTHYYYNGELVSQRKYDELQKLDDMIAQISN